jgi:hypothetical protein
MSSGLPLKADIAQYDQFVSKGATFRTWRDMRRKSAIPTKADVRQHCGFIAHAVVRSLTRGMQKPAFCADRHTANAITTALAKANQVMAYCQVVVPHASSTDGHGIARPQPCKMRSRSPNRNRSEHRISVRRPRLANVIDQVSGSVI